MMPEFKIGDELDIKHNDGIIKAKITKVYNTVIPNYKLESPNIDIPLYLSEPVLKKCLASHLTGSNPENSPTADNVE